MKQLRSLFITGIILAASAAAVFAEGQVTLAELVKEAKEHSPEITAAHEMKEAARARVPQARTWEKPRLSAEFRHFPSDMYVNGATREQMYGISQMIPFPGKLSLQGSAAKQSARRQEEETRAMERRIISQLKSAYAQYVYLTQAIATSRESAQIMQNFSKVAESRYVTGNASQNDVLRAQVEAEKMSTMAETMALERVSMQAEINMLVGRSADTALGEPVDTEPAYISVNWDDIKALVLAHNPGLRQAEADLARARAEKRLSLMEYLPDFDVSYRKDQMDDVWSGDSIMVEASIPLWFWKQGAGVSAMSHEYSAADAQKKNTELGAVARAKEAFTKLEAGRRLRELYSTGVLPKSEQSLKVAQASYTAGRSSFLDLLDSIRSYLSFRLDYYNALADYGKNLALLEIETGTDLK